MFTSLSGGVGVPAFPAPAAAVVVPGMPAPPTPAQYYLPIDPGLVYYDKTGNVHFIDWQSIRVGLQYYLPGLDGKMWISANFSNVSSDNTSQFGLNATKTLKYIDWVDVNLMGDLTPAIRLGVEYANYSQRYNDETLAVDHRVQGSAFYIF
jgi:hypothetical protein